MVAHTIYGLDAIEAAQVLSEIGYLLRQDPKERFRAKAFSAAAWTLARQRPNLVDLQRTESLTSIEGVGVVVEARHLCLEMRGIETPGGRMITSCMLGTFRRDPRTRAEFLNLVRPSA